MEDYFEAVIGTPLAEVFSVTFRPCCDDGFLVYGTIEITDELGTLVLYAQNPSSADFITQDTSIYLRFSDRSISAAAPFTIAFDLKDKNNDADFIKTSFTWDPTTSTSPYDMFLSHNLKGELGSATIYFGVFSVAVEGFFEFFIRKGLGSCSNVYGTIVARYGENITCPSYNLECHSHTLFKRSVQEAVSLKDRDLIPLQRLFAIVPAYSSFVINVDLSFTDSSGLKETIVGEVELLPMVGGYDKLIETNNAEIVLNMEWFYASYLSKSPSLGMNYRREKQDVGYNMLQVFSLLVVSKDTNMKNGIEVYGDIHIYDGDDMVLYDCERYNAKPCLTDGTLALVGPSRAIGGSNFYLTACLKERLKDSILCKADWGVNPGTAFKGYDGCMSAVLKGDDGYGVLNFIIFKDAVQAAIEVTLTGTGSKTSLHGSLVAYYGNYAYETKYLQNNFRTKLLQVPEKEPIELEVPSTSTSTSLDVQKIPLSRCIVAVAEDSLLVIEANLTCKLWTGDLVKINGSATFQPKSSGSQNLDINGINVKVSWLDDPWGILEFSDSVSVLGTKRLLSSLDDDDATS